MKRLPILFGLLLAPTSVFAQGLPIDFDPEPAPAAEAREQARQSAQAGERPARPRSVRHGERTIMMVERTGSVVPGSVPVTRMASSAN